jgi:hypothetical protein
MKTAVQSIIQRMCKKELLKWLSNSIEQRIIKYLMTSNLFETTVGLKLNLLTKKAFTRKATEYGKVIFPGRNIKTENVGGTEVDLYCRH